jgi:hypothetical protein
LQSGRPAASAGRAVEVVEPDAPPIPDVDEVEPVEPVIPVLVLPDVLPGRVVLVLAVLPGVAVCVRTVLAALSQHLVPVALGDVEGVEVCAAATPAPASMTAAAIKAILVIGRDPSLFGGPPPSLASSWEQGLLHRVPCD